MNKIIFILTLLFAVSANAQTVQPTPRGGTGLSLSVTDTNQLLTTNGRNSMHLLPWLNDTTKFLGSDLQWHTVAGGGGMAIGAPVIGGGSQSVLFINGAGNLAQDQANFWWDFTSDILGVVNLAVANNSVSIDGIQYFWPAGQGSANTVLTNDGSGNLSWAAGGGSGLVNWIDSIDISGVNNPTPAIAFVVKTDSVDADAVIQAKGNGATVAQIPDGGLNGDKRGNGATDWQKLVRDGDQAQPSMVASGFRSVISGGNNNTASGDESTVAGGNNNSASNTGATVSGGEGNTAAGQDATVIGGSGSQAIGDYSIAGGNNALSNGNLSSSIGGDGVANGVSASRFGGTQGLAQGDVSTIVGGDHNAALGGTSTIVGGANDSANGSFSSIIGGQNLTLNGLGSLGYNGSKDQSNRISIDDTLVAAFMDVDMWIGGDDSIAHSLKLFAPGALAIPTFPGATNYTAIKSSDTPSASVTYSLPPADGSSNQVLSTHANGSLFWQTISAGSGTVTSVALTAPSIFTVTGSPITTSGTLDFALNTQAQNLVFASPNGSTGTPTFRALVAADIPNLDASILTAGTLAAARMPALTGDVTSSVGTVATTIAANAVTYAKMQAVSTTSKLLGSSSTTTPVQELSLGTGLSLSGTTLSSTVAGLVNWTDALSTSAPNATVPVASLTATNAATNVDAAFVAKGTGATTAQVADNTTAGGNKRANYATDWQKLRANNTEVASGTYSTIGGGRYNRITGSDGVIAGGSSGLLTGTAAAILGGASNQAGGNWSTVLGGNANSASGLYSSVLGGHTMALSGIGSVGYYSGSEPSFHMDVSADSVAVFGNVDFWLADNNGVASSLKFFAPYHTSGAFPSTDKYVGFKAGAVSTSTIWTLPLADGSSGDVLSTNGSGVLSWLTPGAGTGTVTSVGLSLPSSELTVSGSPVTTTGTLSATWANQTTNKFFAAPNGSTGTPTFRAMVAADVPTLNQNTTGSAGTLNPGRTINGTTFDGSTNITVTADANTLTNTTLHSTVVTSSLTSVGTITTGVWNGTAVDATHGGTNQTSWTKGDLLYSDNTNSLAKLGIGSTGQVLTVASGLPSWATSTAMTNPMTTTSDMIYSSSGSTPARLAIGTNSYVLTVSGGVPTWLPPAAGGAGGSDGQMLFNSTGSQAGSTGITTDKASSITLGVASGATGTLKIKGTTSGTATITVPSVAGTPTFTLPASNGNSGQVLTGDGAGILSYSTPTSKLYTVTQGNTVNTLTETDMLSVSVPANDWADGEEIVFDFDDSTKSNDGSDNWALRCYYNGTAFTSNSGGSTGMTQIALSNSASIGHGRMRCAIKRMGSGLFFINGTRYTTSAGGTPGWTTDQYLTGSTMISGGGHLLSQTFTSTATLKITGQFFTATGTNTYFIICDNSARCTKFAKTP